MWNIPKSLSVIAALLMVAGCQLLPPRLTAPGDVAPVAAEPTTRQVDREALIQKALATYSTIPAEPILRIDTNAHIRTIHALALTPRGNLLATASVDRTVRLWDNSTGRLIDTLRVPMGLLGLGTTHALAFSPDGKTLATGGLSFFSRRPATLKQANFTVYFFDVAQRSIARTLDDVPGRIHDLSYSANGKRLAVAYGAEFIPDLGNERLAGTSGIRVYDAQSLTLLKEITTDSPCEWAEFDTNQRLFVACRNTLLAFDDLNLTRIHEAPRDAQFYRAAMAPDGRSLAVSYFDRARMDVLSMDDLSFQFAVDFSSTGNGAAYGDYSDYGDIQPAWSPGGMYLYAAGRRLSGATKENFLFKWDQGGRGKIQAFPAGQMDLLALQAHRDGRVFYATSDGSVATLDARDKGAVLIEKHTVSSDNRPGALWVSADGRTVAYSDDNAGEQRYVFSHTKRTLTPWDEFKDRGSLLPPHMEGKVSQWQTSRQVLCDGKSLDLGDAISQNLAVLRNGQGFAIGTDSGVIFYDANCRRVWENRTQGRTLAINIADEAGLVLAQDEAGVIRWLRVADGFKVLSIFTSRNGKNWAAWTTEGFYDSSPEGESLVGWHLNRTRQRAADFYHAGRFRDLYHNPEEISAALNFADATAAAPESALTKDQKTGRQAEINRLMQANLPPQVSILSFTEKIEPSGPVAHVEYKLRTPSGEPVQRVRALVNGRPAGVVQELAAADGRDDSIHRIKVPLPQGEAEIGLIAENRVAVSEADTVRLNERVAAVQTAAGIGDGQLKPKLYALVVGVGAYGSEKIPSLDFPAKDARDFAAELKRQRGKLYRDVDVRLLEDAKATREAVIDGLDWLRKQVTANDMAVLFLAGHGINDSANRYYFVRSTPIRHACAAPPLPTATSPKRCRRYRPRCWLSSIPAMPAMCWATASNATFPSA